MQYQNSLFLKCEISFIIIHIKQEKNLDKPLSQIHL